MTILHALLWNLAIPAGVSATIITLARRSGRDAISGRPARWGIALGLGLGYLAGHVGLIGWPSVPSPGLDAKVWVVWSALAAMILGIVEVSWTIPTWATWGLRGSFIAAVLGALLGSRLDNGRALGESISWYSGLWALLLVSWWNLEMQADRLSGPGWLIPICLVACGWSAVLVLCRGAALGQLEGVLASTLFGALVTVGLRPGQALSKGGSAIALTVLAGLGLTGFLDSQAPPTAALILIAAPWTPWIDRIGFIRRRSYWTRASIRFLAVLLTVGIAVFVVDFEASLRTEGIEGESSL